MRNNTKDSKALNVFMIVVIIVVTVWIITLILIGLSMYIRERTCYNLPPDEFYQSDFCEVYR